MGAAYTIFGKQVPSHILAIATLAATGAVIAWPRAKAAPVDTKTVVIETKEDDFDLEKFINDLTKEETK